VPFSQLPLAAIGSDLLSNAERVRPNDSTALAYRHRRRKCGGRRGDAVDTADSAAAIAGAVPSGHNSEQLISLQIVWCSTA
jgi:hypothetical protein